MKNERIEIEELMKAIERIRAGRKATEEQIKLVEKRIKQLQKETTEIRKEVREGKQFLRDLEAKHEKIDVSQVIPSKPRLKAQETASKASKGFKM
jgi:septal ring factor EnvC (AmiA/AmiB activator)